ncbi:MAG: S8 family serine peptidase, partial [Bacteroidales bacterium]|nr:S8 family serine peptidase [Bacteroidales bacterium]
MKKVFLLLVFCSCCLWGFSQQESAIESELQAQMNRCKSEEMIDVNIIMKSQYDQMEMRLKSNVFKTKENKRAFVINELKRFSKESQSGIINELQSMEQGMQVKEINAHWIFNGINCKATVEAIEALASNPDILIIGYNRMQNLLPEGEKPTKDNPTKEMVYAITKLNVNDVWDLGFTGEGVIIAVIDTGVNYNHVDVADHMWEDPDFPYHGFDFINNDNNPMDDMGHGSHCAGTVAGDGTAGTQTGMAPDATIMAIKVLNSDGGGNVNAICSGVEFAVE